jgi:hypothetical protein
VSRKSIRGRLRRDRESGQAATEFALILVPMLILIGGIIYFGIGLNYWLDMNKVANQGARWAAVNYWAPQCPRDETSCNNFNSSTPCATVLGTGGKTNAALKEVLRCQTRNPSTTVTVCYPGIADPLQADRGDPVKVKLTAPYKFWFMRSVGITLTASATMRLEQEPTLVNGTGGVPSC